MAMACHGGACAILILGLKVEGRMRRPVAQWLARTPSYTYDAHPLHLVIIHPRHHLFSPSICMQRVQSTYMPIMPVRLYVPTAQMCVGPPLSAWLLNA